MAFYILLAFEVGHLCVHLCVDSAVGWCLFMLWLGAGFRRYDGEGHLLSKSNYRTAEPFC
jgi:hypothetical protein